MNGYQRIMKAMSLEKPDRTPIAEFLIDKNVYRHFFPAAKSQIDLEIAWDFDAVGCGARFNVVEQFSDGTFIDEWMVTYQRNSEEVAHPIKGCINSMDDLKNYTPPDPYHPDRLGELHELVRKYKGEKAITFRHRAAFMWSCYLMGIDNMLMNFILNPDLCHAVLDMVLEVNLQIVRQAIRAGADIIVLGDDYAHNKGTLFSPDDFRTFILPRLQKMVDTIHDEGAMVIKHTDGNIMKILDDIVDTGIDGLNPIEPVAGMDIKYIKKTYGDRISIWGNIDCGDLLCNGSEDQVRKAVVDCIKAAGENGGHILTSSNSIHSSVNPENYRIMIETAKTFPI
ncbi:MAG: hypothetical protein JXN10_02520 [Clostridia bacterium]|nr:hypothetical protein [Clostridia bacterium]